MTILTTEFDKGVKNRAVHLHFRWQLTPRLQIAVRFDLADCKDIVRDRDCFI